MTALKNCEDGSGTQQSTQDELIESSSSRRIKKTRKSKFAESLERIKPTFDPNDKTFERYIDEYYKLDYEDLIGDMPCRFKYRQVKANDFGLTTAGKLNDIFYLVSCSEIHLSKKKFTIYKSLKSYYSIYIEVLSAPDRELNAWSSLKKTCSYRDENDELKDIEAYKSKANDVQLKKKIIPSLFNDDGPQEALEAEKEKKSAKSKTRRRQKRKTDDLSMQNKGKDEINGEVEHSSKKAKLTKEIINRYEDDTFNVTSSDKKSKKKKKHGNKHTESNNDLPVTTEKTTPHHKATASNSKFNKLASHTNPPNKKMEVNAEMKMSDKRLEAYGIAPNPFKRKKIKEKYRQGAK